MMMMMMTDDRDDFQASGDPRRCPRHPDVATSSPDGMFDAPCGTCEYEMDMEAPEADALSSGFLPVFEDDALLEAKIDGFFQGLRF